MAPRSKAGDASLDPYHLVVEEICASLKKVEEGLYNEKLEGLIRDNAGSGKLQALQTSLESVEMQITELSKAVEASSARPDKFNLTKKEVQERIRSVNKFNMETRKYHDRILDLFEAVALSKKAHASRQSPSPARNSIVSSYLNDEADRTFDNQQLLMKQQDEDLEHLGKAAQRVGQMGLQIGEEIELQSNMIGDLDEEVDTAKSRLLVAKRMMDKLGRKMGKWQSVVMIALVVLLIILVMIVFS